MKKLIGHVLALILILSLPLQSALSPAYAAVKPSPIVPKSLAKEADDASVLQGVEVLDRQPDKNPISQRILQDSELSPELREQPRRQAAAPELREFTPPSAEVIAQTKAKVQSFNCATVTDVLETECEALVALYSSTNGAGWTNRENWLTSTTVGSWYGVQISTNHVSQIDLGVNNLTGSIPSEMGNLSALLYLNLWNNALSGIIPSELANLTELEDINLDYNQLSGSIPSQILNLPKLRRLVLTSNQLTGIIPTEMASPSNITHLLLGSNKLSGTIPVALGSLAKLYNLFLDSNQLTGTIPPAICDLELLYTLNLQANQLSGSIPTEMGALLKLEHLYLDHNQLSGEIPTYLPYKLQHLYLDHNQLTGGIPAELGSLSNLWILSLGSNQLTGSIPSALGNSPHLFELSLGFNQLSGSIPPEIGNLTLLRGLLLNNNMLSGDIPAGFINMVNLCKKGDMGAPCYGDYDTDLSYNWLKVPEPGELGTFLALKDPGWNLTQAVQEEIPGGSGGTLLSNDGKTEINIPPDAVTGTVTFLFDPQPAPSQDVGELSFAGNSFALTAMLGETPITSFAAAIILTLHYDPASLGTIPEDSLALFYWDTDQSAWVDAVTTCTGGIYTRNLEDDWLSVPICHLSEFALLSQPVFKIFLPLTLR